MPDADPAAAPSSEDNAALADLEKRVVALERIFNNLQGGKDIHVENGIIEYTGPDPRSQNP